VSAALALRAATAQLQAAGVEGAARDARLLLAHALGIAPDRLTLVLQDPLPPGVGPVFEAAIARRAAREPLSHITGKRLFWGREFIVSDAVLDPRPETETLVEQALGVDFATVLDLGTGSGCIVLSLLADRPRARGLGVDLSEPALKIAKANAAALGVSTEFVLSDWFGAVEGRFDLIVSNPPYIRADEMAALSPEVRNHEPHLALTPGGDGLAAYRKICAKSPAYLAPGGWLMVETGWHQGPAVAALFSQAGFADVRIVPDLGGQDRVVRGRLAG
jgi:release factor glutamine methyltransferase